LRRLLVAIGFVGVVGVVAVLLQSPAMAIREIEVVGVQRANVAAVLEDYNVAIGVPTISLRPAELAAEVEADPWVARAKAEISWPGTVNITVLEHEPIGWLKIEGEWFRASATGAILERSAPSKHGARIRLGGVRGEPGDTLTGGRTIGALEFLATLPKELRKDAVIRSGGAGTLVARIDGHLVALGTPLDMKEKAATLTALLEAGVPSGAAISVVSPLRPAIRNPQQVVEG
jgi:cell division protein FtsQ